jgi:hypothetical protein
MINFSSPTHKTQSPPNPGQSKRENLIKKGLEIETSE